MFVQISFIHKMVVVIVSTLAIILQEPYPSQSEVDFF